MIFSFQRHGDTGVSEIHAFPSDMADRVKQSVSPLARDQMHSPSDTVISVRMDQETLSIPYRVYYEKRRILSAMDSPGDTGVISLCLGTRHYDGFIREQCLRRLLDCNENWTAPFVVQLLGEYVIEVIEPVHERFIEGVEAKYTDFFKHNAGYCEYLERRAISYWNEYYRRRYAKHNDYPAVRALAALKKAAVSSEDNPI